VRAAADEQRVFDDVVALGLADGRLTARTLAATVHRVLQAAPQGPAASACERWGAEGSG